MATSEERIKILQMVQEGKITADQAAELLQVLEDRGASPKAAPAPTVAAPGRAARWFRVRVTDTDTGKVRVNVRMPVGMLNAGMKLGMRFTPEVEGLDPEVLSQLIQSGEIGQIVDVVDEQDGEHVEVFIE